MARLHPCHLLPPEEAVEMAELGKMAKEVEMGRMAKVVEMGKMGKDLGKVAVIGEMPVRKEEKTVRLYFCFKIWILILYRMCSKMLTTTTIS